MGTSSITREILAVGIALQSWAPFSEETPFLNGT